MRGSGPVASMVTKDLASTLGAVAGTCPLRLNQGMWYVCAHVIGDKVRLVDLLRARDVAVLEREVSYLEGFVD